MYVRTVFPPIEKLCSSDHKVFFSARGSVEGERYNEGRGVAFKEMNCVKAGSCLLCPPRGCGICLPSRTGSSWPASPPLPSSTSLWWVGTHSHRIAFVAWLVSLPRKTNLIRSSSSCSHILKTFCPLQKVVTLGPTPQSLLSARTCSHTGLWAREKRVHYPLGNLQLPVHVYYN